MEILDEIEIITKKKRDLLPIWIKIFIWIFLIMSAIIPIAIIFAFLGYPSIITIYGFRSYTVFSPIGFIISCLILYKGIISYGLWFEKKWAVKHAIIDGIIGILACIVSMTIPLVTNYGILFSYRLELIALVPYLFKMYWIKNEWNDEAPIQTIKSDDAEDEEHDDEIIEKEIPTKEIIYKKYTYNCEDGILTIEQEFQNPNVGEKVFLNDKPAPFGKYKLGFMSHIFVDNGIVESISNF